MNSIEQKIIIKTTPPLSKSIKSIIKSIGIGLILHTSLNAEIPKNSKRIIQQTIQTSLVPNRSLFIANENTKNSQLTEAFNESFVEVQSCNEVLKEAIFSLKKSLDNNETENILQDFSNLSFPLDLLSKDLSLFNLKQFNNLLQKFKITIKNLLPSETQKPHLSNISNEIKQITQHEYNKTLEAIQIIQITAKELEEKLTQHAHLQSSIKNLYTVLAESMEKGITVPDAKKIHKIQLNIQKTNKENITLRKKIEKQLSTINAMYNTHTN
ncbi:hypothetical protein COB57_05950 [Candidatus Peregrinibacteria bacterium]|nr:MAG: hypothetical protein COB57_05950 [Candidatus Peregrinibacteria bacterium]